MGVVGNDFPFCVIERVLCYGDIIDTNPPLNINFFTWKRGNEERALKRVNKKIVRKLSHISM